MGHILNDDTSRSIWDRLEGLAHLDTERRDGHSLAGEVHHVIGRQINRRKSRFSARKGARAVPVAIAPKA